MKKLLFVFSVVLLLTACGNSNQGELVGVRRSNKTFNQPDPYGMVFVPQGSFTMGVGGEDITGSYLNEPKTVSVSAFFMDDTRFPRAVDRLLLNVCQPTCLIYFCFFSLLCSA